VLPATRGNDDAACQVASAVKALARHACGRSALLAAGAEAALAAAAESWQEDWAPAALAEALEQALELVRRPPEQGPEPLAASSAPRLCAACGAPGSRARPLMRCAGCRGPERWCSSECQRGSWAGHRAVCLERRAAAAAAATAAAAAGSSQQAV
jgi:hypothetical protein